MWARDLDRHFCKEHRQMTSKPTNRCSTSLARRGNANENHSRLHFMPSSAASTMLSVQGPRQVVVVGGTLALQSSGQGLRD